MASFKYVISGGSGWMGRALIHSLIDKRIISNPKEICVYSSRATELNFSGFGKVLTRPFLESDFREIEGVEGFFHLAFLTRNLITRYGLTQYIATNQQLTSKAAEFIRVINPAFVGNVSSGAIFSQESGVLGTNMHVNPYGYLKVLEESLLIETCDAKSINLCIGRLWGATGKQMPINRAYAISDFISQAILHNRIEINSSNLVFRRYCDASEFMMLLFLVAEKRKFTTLDSGGPKVEIGELARLIAKEFSSDLYLIRKINPDLPYDEYYPKSELYEDLSAEFGMNLTDLPTQVKRTIDGHLVHFGY